jgi:hypothetical protein
MATTMRWSTMSRPLMPNAMAILIVDRGVGGHHIDNRLRAE